LNLGRDHLKTECMNMSPEYSGSHGRLIEARQVNGRPFIQNHRHAWPQTITVISYLYNQNACYTSTILE